MALSVSEREAFLAESHVAALAVDGEPGRGPVTVPVWYHYAPGEDPWILIHPESRKAGLIKRAGRFSLLAFRTTPTQRYVSVEGPLTGSAPSTPDDIRAIAGRYLPEERLDDFIELVREEHVFRMRAEHWLSADLGAA